MGRFMGLLVDGVWHDDWYNTKSTGGKFERSKSRFRNWITPDGAPGETGAGGFAAESGRYHLYVSHACPWAHRTMIFRKLKGLEEHISVSIVDAMMLDKGWAFSEEAGAIPDSVNGADYMHQIYTKADASYSGRVTVPVVWDKANNTIVSNESADIIRMFNSAFNGLTGNDLDFYPEELRDIIDPLNERVYDTLNNGVYKCGFATSQDAYEEAFEALFATVEYLEILLGGQRFLAGKRLTEADWRLFTTLARFDPVYYGHFKCNLKRIVDYPNLSNYFRDLYQRPGISETINMDHIKRHYYGSHESVNPTRIVPKGPVLTYNMAHDRNRFEETFD